MSDRTVLVVDDQLDFLDVMQRALALDGYDVVCATTSTEALARVEATHPVCVIVDHRLMGTSGTTLTKQLRERFGSGLVIVMCSAHCDAAHRDAAERAGVDLVLPKPVDFGKLRTVLPPNPG